MFGWSDASDLYTGFAKGLLKTGPLYTAKQFIDDPLAGPRATVRSANENGWFVAGNEAFNPAYAVIVDGDATRKALACGHYSAAGEGLAATGNSAANTIAAAVGGVKGGGRAGKRVAKADDTSTIGGDSAKAAAKTGLTKGANGALRDPVTGRFAANPNRAVGKLPSAHGNARSSQAVTTLYRRVTSGGDFQKWGVTNNLRGRYGASELGTDQLIPMTSGTRSEMLNLERWLVERDPGPLNFERWAGSVK